MDARSLPSSHCPAVRIAKQSAAVKLRLPKLETNLFQNIRLVAEDIGLQEGYLESLLATKKASFSSRWSTYKKWCYEFVLHPFCSSFRSLIDYELVLSQVMDYLSYIKPKCSSHASFADTKTMLARVFRFGLSLGTDAKIMPWMKGWGP